MKVFKIENQLKRFYKIYIIYKNIKVKKITFFYSSMLELENKSNNEIVFFDLILTEEVNS